MTVPVPFGTSARRLFGVYDPPRKRARERAILLCYPGGQEYMRAYPGFKQLAMRLSREGAHVFRFDYFGTGDSAGDDQEVSLSGWADDITTAIDELASMASVSRFSMIGLRLGATLAARISTKRKDIDDLILWDPIIDGAAHLRKLSATHSDMMRDPMRFRWPRTAGESEGDEIIGFSFPSPMREEIAEIDSTALAEAVCKRLILIGSKPDPSLSALRGQLESKKPKFEYQEFAAKIDWHDFGQIENAFSPQEIISFIVEKITADK